MRILSLILKFVGIFVLLGLGVVIVFSLGAMLLVLLAMVAIAAIVVYVADIPVDITRNDKKIGTWSRTKGFTKT